MSETPATTFERRLGTHIVLGLSCYLASALADGLLTLQGMQGNLELEGNPLMRWMMTAFGHSGGLLVEKMLVALFAAVLTVVVALGIHRRREWVYRLALTPFTRRWMKRRRRYWIAWLPLYLCAVAQGVAAGVWWWLIYGQPR